MKNAILVESDKPGTLAGGIEKVLKDHDFCAKSSKQAYENVQKYT